MRGSAPARPSRDPEISRVHGGDVYLRARAPSLSRSPLFPFSASRIPAFVCFSHRWKVVPSIPCCRHTSATVAPGARASSSIAIFCATVYLRFFRVTLPSLFLGYRPLAG